MAKRTYAFSDDEDSPRRMTEFELVAMLLAALDRRSPVSADLVRPLKRMRMSVE